LILIRILRLISIAETFIILIQRQSSIREENWQYRDIVPCFLLHHSKAILFLSLSPSVCAIFRKAAFSGCYFFR